MTERRLYIGSLGPFLYDDTDVYPTPGGLDDQGFGDGVLMNTVVSDGAILVGSFKLWDTDTTHSLELKWNEDDSADRILNLLVGGGNRSLTMGANLTVESNAIVSQDYSSDSTSVSLAGLALTGQLTLTTTDQNGIVFGSLGTATRGIDLSSSGLSGNSDYLWYFGADDHLTASGRLEVSDYFAILGTPVVDKDGYGNVNLGAATNANLQLRHAGYGQIIADIDAASTFFLGNKAAVGSLTNCTSNGTTTITKTSHGLSVAVGDLIHIKDTDQASDEGFYRLVSTTANTLVVGRALAGSLSDVDLTVYKDVIGFFATDGTNGQHIVGFSHQDKPLVIGGDRAGTGVGTVPATSNSLGGEDILIGAKLEVDGVAYFDAAVTFAGTVTVPATNFTIGSTTFSETQLGEVTTFFGSTDISAAEAETLTDTSDADALHSHATLVAAHAMLDGSVHNDSVADTVTRGSIIYGNTTPDWDELVIGTGFLRGDGTDCAWLSYANSLAALSATAGVTFDWNDQQISNIKSIAFNDGGATVTQVKDENNMASDSQTMLATQASIKAYVDAVGGVAFATAAVLGTL